MKVKKGFYKVMSGVGWREEEGSYINCFPFMIHRSLSQSGQTWGWSLSHKATGHSVQKALTLKGAKLLAKELSAFSVFNVPTLDTWRIQMSIMQTHRETEYKKMMKIIEECKNVK